MEKKRQMKIDRLRRSTTLSVAILVGLVVSFWALLQYLSPEAFDPDVLDGLGQGYEVAELVPTNCGNGRTYVCSRSFSIRHPGSIEQLAAELHRLDVVVTTPSSLRASSPGEAILVVHWVVDEMPIWALVGLILLPLSIALAALALLISFARMLIEMRRSEQSTYVPIDDDPGGESPPVRWSH